MTARVDAASLRGYLLDPLAFVANLLVLETGQTYGEAWQPFQREFFEAVFAVKADGTPLHRLIYDERRRGESKTEDAAAAAVADLITGPRRHRSYAVAGDMDQAGLLLDSVQGFASRSPMLAKVVDIQRWVVHNRTTGSQLRIMSADDRTAYGIRPRKVFFDEVSLQQDEKLWTPMWSAVGKRKDAQMVGLSMAGWDFAGLAWRIRELARSTEGYYFATREGSELAPWLLPEQMEEQRASLHPADFARFWECRWTEPMGSWITREMYDAAEQGRETVKADQQFRRVGFVDVGLVRDATAVAVCHSEADRVVLDTLRTMRGSRDAPVELEALEELVLDLTKRYHVGHWTFEAPQAVASVQRLEKKLRGRATVVARYPTVETQARLFGSLYQLFANHRLVIYPHDQLRREALNLVTKTVGGRLKVVESSSIHQDHVIALGGAADLLLREADWEPQTWPAAGPGGSDWVTRALERLGVNRDSLSTSGATGLSPEVAGHSFLQVGPVEIDAETEAPSLADSWPMSAAGNSWDPGGQSFTQGVTTAQVGNHCNECGRSRGHDADCDVLLRRFGLGAGDWLNL